MKKYTYLIAILFTFSILLGAPAYAQQFKVACVDMNKVFDEYYKTKSAVAQLKDRASACEKELKDQEEEIKKLSNQIQKLKDESASPAISDEVKTQNRKTMESKMTEGQIKVQNLKQMFETRKHELDEQRNKTRNALVDEITKVVQEKGKKDGYSMIVDKSGLNLSQVSPFVFVQDSLDITAEVIRQLNANAPVSAAPSTSKPK